MTGDPGSIGLELMFAAFMNGGDQRLKMRT
jgi:hypothetical protein